MMFDHKILGMIHELNQIQFTITTAYNAAQNAARLVAEKGIDNLTPEEKGKVFDALTGIAAMLDPYREIG